MAEDPKDNKGPPKVALRKGKTKALRFLVRGLFCFVLFFKTISKKSACNELSKREQQGPVVKCFAPG